MTSDCGAIVNTYNGGINGGSGFSGGHGWRPPELARQVTRPEGSAYSLKAGTDVDCAVGTWSYPRSSASAPNASHLEISQTLGLTTEQDWDIALTRAFTVRMQTGEFDADNPYRNAAYTSGTAGENSVASPEHLELAHKMSLEAPVLLKNEDKVLPFTNKTGSTVIVGYYGATPVHGGYSPASTTVTKSAYQGLVDYLPPAATVTSIANADLGFYSSAKPLPPYSTSQVNAVGPALSYRQNDETQVGTVAWNATTWDVDGSGFTDNATGTYRIRSGASVVGWYQANLTNIPAGTDKLRLSFADGTTLRNSDGEADDCLTSVPGCKTIGLFTVTAGGASVDVPLYKKEVQTGASNWVTRYVPLSIPLASLGLTPGSNATVRFTFGIEGMVPGGGNFVLTPSQEQLIADADNVVVYVGTNTSDSNEEQDRAAVNFPQSQAQMAQRVAQLNPDTVVWIQAVGQMNITPFKDAVKAIVWSTYNGEFQGHAAAETLFGATVNLGGKSVVANPSGKLPYTYYSDVPTQLTASTDYALNTPEYKATTDPDGTICGRTYWYYKTGPGCDAPDYPFGHGLSYTTFAYSGLSLSASSATPNDTIDATVTVTNTGTIAGREVVELYASSPAADGLNRPLKQLKGFTKTDTIQPGASVTVTIPLKVSDLWFWDDQNQRRTYDQGAWKIQVAPSSADGAGLSATLNLSGDRKAGVDVVAAVPDGVSLNTRTPDNVINANLSATKHDQSFWDLEDPAVKVSYTSADERIAKVTPEGVVSAVGQGATLITATVSADGETKSTTFPVAVQGRRVQADAPSTAYDYWVSFGNKTLTLAQAEAGARLTADVSVATTDETYEFLIAPMDLNEIGAEVTSDGVLTASEEGKVQVTVVADIGGVKVSRHAYVEVVAPIEVGWQSAPPSGSVTAYLGQPLALPALAAAAEDGSKVTYSATGLPSGVVLDPETGAFVGTPTAAGSYPVAVTVTGSADGLDYVAATASFTLQVTAAPPPPPVAVHWALRPVGTVTVKAGEPVALTPLAAAAADGSPLAYSATGLPPGVTINSTTGAFSGTPTAPGTYTVAVTATSASSPAAYTAATATFTVQVTAVAPPVPVVVSWSGRPTGS
ncbi:MAG: glycoside hydrolase family 3 C-terminal domain-containing protein, partial [Bifidobacteriaceae bacterium]|nr:glycoside hydrolase family 3 C-terminal domain-containing protein [Bifidobacteriaceae bacterium]